MKDLKTNQTDNFGLSVNAIEWITRVLKVFPEIEEAIIFGSRAKGTEKPGSDIDIAIKGNLEDYRLTERLRLMLQEGLYLPYFFDIVDYERIENPALKDHIDRVGKLFYKQS
ncbi:MAG: nucleotidyltransferase domain-containing protein [Leptospiraceae bacterium]|nr:nucleotidyltransferase domain-containing protein [Leptospiraceae bacterium]